MWKNMLKEQTSFTGILTGCKIIPPVKIPMKVHVFTGFKKIIRPWENLWKSYSPFLQVFSYVITHTSFPMNFHRFPTLWKCTFSQVGTNAMVWKTLWKPEFTGFFTINVDRFFTGSDPVVSVSQCPETFLSQYKISSFSLCSDYLKIICVLYSC